MPPTAIPEKPDCPAHVFAQRVTYRMTDQMGVMYYGNYLELFEIGRTEMLRSTGMTYRQMEEDGFYLPVTQAALDYRASARYDDLLEIHTRVAALSRARLTFHYEVTRAGEDGVLCRGMTRHAAISREGRPRRLDERWRAALEPLMATGEKANLESLRPAP